MKRVMHQDGLVAFRSGGNHGDGHAGQCFDALQVGARIGRQRGEAFHPEGTFAPARQLFVYGPTFGDCVRTRRKQLGSTSRHGVGGAYANQRHAVENIELGDGQAIDAIELN